MTDCECTGPKDGEKFFFCKRHGIRKTEGWHQLCKTRENYFASWESGAGVGHESTNKQPVVNNRTGPGAELEQLLASIGIKERTGCGGCGGKARVMNAWGVNGCERRFDEIVCWLKESSEKYGWQDKFVAMVRMAAWHPLLAVKLNPMDPFPGLIRESIERARRREISKADKET